MYFVGHEYIKVILRNKRMVGAILIGDTDLEVITGAVVGSLHCFASVELSNCGVPFQIVTLSVCNQL